MRTTITLDDELVARARELAGIEETSALVRLALKRYVESEAARRLARLGGSDPGATIAVQQSRRGAGPRRHESA
jgi:Arc/MetJ family transcription regulator